jgi:hypothetical protein
MLPIAYSDVMPHLTELVAPLRARLGVWHAAFAVAFVAVSTWAYLEVNATPVALLAVVFVALFALLVAFAVHAARASGWLTAPTTPEAPRHGPPTHVATRALERRVRANGARAPGAAMRRTPPAR